MENKYSVYYYLCVISFVIPIISYIILPGVDVIPSLLKAFFIIFIYKKMQKLNIVRGIHLDWIGKTLLTLIALSSFFCLASISYDRLSIALLLTEVFSWSILLVSLMVTDITSVKHFLKAYFVILVVSAVFSGFYWDGFFTYDVPHVLTPLSLCLLISLYAPFKVRVFIISALFAGVLYDYSVRSCLLTVIATVLIFIGYEFCPKNLTSRFLGISRKILFILPFFFLAFAFIFNFNIFEAIENQDISTGAFTNGRKSEGHLMNTDSRTLVYVDVINASSNAQNVLLGHGPVIDLESYWMSNRHSVEAGILNIYLRYGLLGCFLFFLILYKASFKGMYDSKNHLTQLASVYIAYKFLLMFMDDPSFEGSLFVALGICMSSSIRNLTDEEIKNSFNKFKLI